MKKAIAILLSLTMILGLAACGNSASQTEQPSTEDTSVESKADTNSAENSTDMENTDNQDVQDHKVLVAYFSATGTTKGVAEHMLRHMTPAKQMITARGFAQPDVPTNWVLTTLIPPPAMVMA